MTSFEMTRHPPRRRALLLTAGIVAVTAMAGCTFYHAQPLASPDVESILDSPDRATLSDQAAKLQHPLLPPIKLDF
jgi:hypothetical protein